MCTHTWVEGTDSGTLLKVRIQLVRWEPVLFIHQFSPGAKIQFVRVGSKPQNVWSQLAGIRNFLASLNLPNLKIRRNARTRLSGSIRNT